MQKIITANKPTGQKTNKQKIIPNKSITNLNNLLNNSTMHVIKNMLNK